MKIKISKTTERQLNWLVSVCQGATDLKRNTHRFDNEWVVTFPCDGGIPGFSEYLDNLDYSTDWSMSGEIIEREKIAVEYTSAGSWHAAIEWLDEPSHTEIGPTALIAAMRCFVASRLGDEVDVPEELK